MVTSPLISLSTQTTAPAAILTLQRVKQRPWTGQYLGMKMLANVAS